MAYNYDALYATTPNALGEPTKVFVDFFASYNQANARILDVGCGQGRDALFIARLGHRVVGVDLSPSGIQDMIAVAEQEGLPVEGVVTDIAVYSPDGMFDAILIDRTLHMLDEKPRLDTLARLLSCVAAGGWILIEDERTNIAGFKSIFERHKTQWDVMQEKRGTLFLRRA
jgi:SAM-dependent methyltransferase